MPSEPDVPANEPNLELPSFGFGRKKKRSQKAEAAPSADGGAARPAADEEQDTAGTPAPSTDGASDPQDEAGERTATPSRTAASASAPAAPAAPPAPPAPARVPTGPTPARPPARPAARPPARPPSTVSQAGVTPAAASPPPARPPAARPPVPPPSPPTVAGADTVQEPAVVDPLEAAAAALDAPRRPRSDRTRARRDARAARREEKAAQKAARKEAQEQQRARDETRAQPAGPATDTEAAEDLTPEAKPDRTTSTKGLAGLPAVKPVYAALITGLLSGLAAVLLAIGASRGCEAVRDTSSCGGGLGLLATVVLLALEVLIGASLLKAWQISDPFSTSFLGVGIVAIIAMLTFLSHLDSPWMLLVIPLMTAASFALSWWVTVRFIDENPMSSEADSERGEPAFAPKPKHDEESHA